MSTTPQTSTQPVLSVERLRSYYQMKYFGIDREVRAVDDITLHIDRNEIYGLAGESSSGKTSFIKTIAAANRPPLNVVGGSVKFSFIDRDIHSLDRDALAQIRWKHLSYIMQGSMNVLNPVRRIRKSFFDFAFRHIGRSRAEFLDIVREHLRRLHLEPSVLDAYPHELSGGMRQRVTIALATICRPEFIIADEPTTALDVVVQKGVLGVIREVQREMRSSILFVTHDMAVHANMADRLGIMYAGRLVEEAPTRQIFANPLHPYTAHLIESLPRIGDVAPKKALEGTPPNLSAPPPGCRFHPRCPLAMEICRREVPALTTLAPGHRVACFAASTAVKPMPQEDATETAA
jgi:peptide/nickel transport system ATP-binding protein